MSVISRRRGVWQNCGILVLALLAGLAAAAWAQEPAPLLLGAAEFLREARTPFQRHAWGRFKGHVEYRGGDLGRIRQSLDCSLLFAPEKLQAQFHLAGLYTYTVTQTYAGALPRVTLDVPEDEGISLRHMGIEPEDLTVSVIYWHLESELPGETVRGQDCRVMAMKHPERQDRAVVWFSAKYFFPLRIQWLRPGEAQPWRTVEFSEFKKHGDLWFVKSVNLHGDKWRTRVVFAEGEINTDEPAPADLLR